MEVIFIIYASNMQLQNVKFFMIHFSEFYQVRIPKVTAQRRF